MIAVRPPNAAHEGTDMKHHQSGREQNEASVAIGIPDGNWEGGALDLPETIDPQIPDQDDDYRNERHPDESSYRTIAIGPPDVAAQNDPAFLRRSFGSNDWKPNRMSFRPSNLFAFIIDLWRTDSAEAVSSEKNERVVHTVGRAAFAFLILVVVVTCVGAAIALGQIKSLKSDIAMLQRELVPLREHLAKLEQVEKAKREAEEVQRNAETEKNKLGGEIGSDQTALSLSREEIQLIREYIKSAPGDAAAAPVIKVGDPITGAMIPLPSQVTEKAPKLLGAKFTSRNGVIIIVRKNSRQADAVVPPN